MKTMIGLAVAAVCIFGILSPAKAGCAPPENAKSCPKGQQLHTDINGHSGCCPRGYKYSWDSVDCKQCSRNTTDIIPPSDVKLHPTPVAPDAQLKSAPNAGASTYNPIHRLKIKPQD